MHRSKQRNRAALTSLGLLMLGLTGLPTATLAQAEDRGRLAALDFDGDGVVTFPEFQEAAPDMLGRRDIDASGSLSLGEYLTPERARRDRGPRSLSEEERAQLEARREAQQERREQRRLAATARFEQIDLDGDGALSEAELQESMFLRLDRDGNGVLSAEELERGRGAHRRGARRGEAQGRQSDPA